MNQTPSSTTVASASTSIGTSSSIAQPRTVSGVFRATPQHWVGNGFYVSSYFPRQGLPAERVSPFLLMDYGPPRDFPPAARERRGVGWHPHRGFETVTVAWEGAVAHADNAGHRGVIGPGDVQWMTAASGIVHEEFHEDAFAREGGRLHMMQLWVNLPRKNKMDPPGYQPIVAADVPVVTLADGGGTVRVIAGEYSGAKGPAKTFTPLSLFDVDLAPNGRAAFALPRAHNAMAIVTSGKVTVAGKTIVAGELILFENDGAGFELTAIDEAHLLVLAGEPIDEPIVQYGPFVMNTEDEIRRAYLDFQSGKFGRIPS
jgi:redox-sensitive bicupin YhaK (pirin superfamily)